MTIRVILADDHPLIRAGLANLIEDIGGFAIVAQAGDGLEALALAEEHRPDLMLMDIQMPILSGLDCLARLKETHPEIKILMLSMHADADYVRRALDLGARGYLMKGANPADLELALKTVSGGSVWLSAEVAEKAIGQVAQVESARVANDALTPRQKTILKRLAEGASGKEIAFELNVSIKTVETHRTQVMERLGLRDLPALVRYAIREGIISA